MDVAVKGHVDRSRGGKRAWPRPWLMRHGDRDDLVHVGYEVEVVILFMWATGLSAVEKRCEVG